MKLRTYDQSKKLSICIPCRDIVHSKFTYSLIQLVQWCNHSGLAVNVIMETGSLIPNQRQSLVKSAINIGASHILWLDSDMTFPSTIAETLLGHDLPIIACNYSTRSLPFKTVAYTDLSDWNSWIRLDNPANKFDEVEGVGMGCMLVNTTVYSKMSLPWFDVTYDTDNQEFIGEDFYFCKKAKSMGYKIIIDNFASQEIKHIASISV